MNIPESFKKVPFLRYAWPRLDAMLEDRISELLAATDDQARLVAKVARVAALRDIVADLALLADEYSEGGGTNG